MNNHLPFYSDLFAEPADSFVRLKNGQKYCLADPDGEAGCSAILPTDGADHWRLREALLKEKPVAGEGQETVDPDNSTLCLPIHSVRSLTIALFELICDHHRQYETYYACRWIAKSSRTAFLGFTNWDARAWRCLAAREGCNCSSPRLAKDHVSQLRVDHLINKLALGDVREKTVKSLVHLKLCDEHLSEIKKHTKRVLTLCKKFIPVLRVESSSLCLLDDPILDTSGDYNAEANRHPSPSSTPRNSPMPEQDISPPLEHQGDVALPSLPRSKRRNASLSLPRNRKSDVPMRQQANSSPVVPQLAEERRAALVDSGISRKQSRPRACKAPINTARKSSSHGAKSTHDSQPNDLEGEVETRNKCRFTGDLEKQALNRRDDDSEYSARSLSKEKDREEEEDDSYTHGLGLGDYPQGNTLGGKDALPEDVPTAMSQMGPLDGPRPSLDASGKNLPSDRSYHSDLACSPPRQELPTRIHKKRKSDSGSLVPEFQKLNECALTAANITARVFEEMQKPLKKSYGDGLIYILSTSDHAGYVKIGRTARSIEARRKEIQRCYKGRVSNVSDHAFCQVPFHQRVETLIFKGLEAERQGVKCPCRSKGDQRDEDSTEPASEHFEWFQLDVAKADRYVDKWRTWMRTQPYDEEGNLRKKWRNRISYFEKETHQRRNLLSTLDSDKRWDAFLEPSVGVRLRIEIHDWLHRPRLSRWERVLSIRLEDHYDSLIFRGAFSFYLLWILYVIAFSDMRSHWPMALTLPITFFLGVF